MHRPLNLGSSDADPARSFGQTVTAPEDARLRQVRAVRDYGMFDRREAPQYYPDAERRAGPI